MKKKKLVHFTWKTGSYSAGFAACGQDLITGNFVKTTDRRDRVTCKRCRATRRFRKVK